MSNVQYYCLELDDYSAVSFCSFGKCYFGTLEDIRAFIDSLDNKNLWRGLNGESTTNLLCWWWTKIKYSFENLVCLQC